MTPDIQRHHSNARISKMVQHAGLILLCGQTSGGTSIGDIRGQTREVPGRIDALLQQAGSRRERMLSAAIYLSSRWPISRP